MNKDLIQKFLNKACWDEQAQHELEDWLNVEKFAELIVQECASVAAKNQAEDMGWDISEIIKEHFGVEDER